MPVFTHDEKDIASFRMITSQFYVNGIISQIDIINTFGVSKNSVKRAVKKYRTYSAPLCQDQFSSQEREFLKI
jgi:transposase